MSRVWVALFLVVVVVCIGLVAAERFGVIAIQPTFRLSDRLSRLPIQETPDGLRLIYDQDDPQQQFTPDEMITRVYARQRERGGAGGLFSFLDITSWTGVLWVGIGLLGQVMFTGRMLVQWIASEREKSSVVPVAFWWMSLLGASMLLVYFIWRVDVVGVLGQATGWSIYLRNLWLIYNRPDLQTQAQPQTGPQPVPQPAPKPSAPQESNEPA